MARVSVNILGLLRLNTGLHSFDADAAKVSDLFPTVLGKARALNPNTTASIADAKNSIVLVNNAPARKTTKLKDGDIVFLMSPVCGG